MITWFVGDNSFLSNSYKGKPIPYGKDGDGKLIEWKSVLHAYESAKHSDLAIKRKIWSSKRESIAIRYGHMGDLYSDSWPKIDIMRELLYIKFSHYDMKDMLIGTNPVELQFGNMRHDIFWGICHCPACGCTGQNNLGKLLMEIRKSLGDYHVYNE